MSVLVDGGPGGSLPAGDPGLRLGLTVFETLRTYGSRPFRLERHLDRLERSARAMDVPLPPRDLLVSELLGACAPDVRLRLTLTAGGHRILDVAPVDRSRVCAPVRVATIAWEPFAFLPGWVKHGSRAPWVLAARRLGVDEVLLVDASGHLLEASRSSVFGVLDGELLTPPLDGRLLAGVTRGAMLEAAAEAGIGVRERPLPSGAPFEELYLASTLKELAPVASTGGRPGPGGGPVGAAMLSAFRRLVERETGPRA